MYPKIIMSFPFLLLFNQANAQFLNNSSDTISKVVQEFRYDKSIFNLNVEQLANKNRFLRFSVLTGYRDGVKPITGLANFTNFEDIKNGTYRICMFNLSIQDMLTHGLYKSNRVILEVKHPEKYSFSGIDPGEYKEWLRKNGYCFELLLPTGIVGNKILDRELSHIFHVKFGVEKRLVNTLVLVRTSAKDKIKSKSKGPGNYTLSGHFQNVPLDRLMHPLNNANMPPMVDETGYKGNIDMDLKVTDWKDIAQIRSELLKYDLNLLLEKREAEMFIIKEI